MSRIVKREKELGCSRCDRQIAERHGLSAWHMVGLREFCRDNQMLLILRSSKSSSRKFHNRSGFVPKPSDVKGKTVNGFVAAQSDVYKNTKMFYSDYDIMALVRRFNDGYRNVVPMWDDENGVQTREGLDVLQMLNEYMGDSTPFQHGANDQYSTRGKKYMNNEIRTTEWFLTFDETMRVFEFFNARSLKRFYDERGIKWQDYYINYLLE